MKTIPRSARLPALLAGASALLLAGCISKPAATLVTEEKVVTKNFKWVYVTGSHIPIAVPTSPNARAVPGISPIEVYTNEDDMRRGLRMH